MLALAEWGEGRYLPMVMMAQNAVAGVKDYHNLVLQTRGFHPRSLPESQGIRLKEWLKLYSCPSQLWEVLAHYLLSPETLSEVKETVLRSSHSRLQFEGNIQQVVQQNLTNERLTKLKRIEKRVHERQYYQYHLPELLQRLQGNVTIPTNTAQWYARPEPSFFLAVVVPCWLEYQTTPWQLFQAARRGNFEALEKLLRLDPEVDKEKRLQATIFNIQHSQPEQYRMLNHARSCGRQGKFELADMKFLIGGLLMKYSKQWDDILRGELYFKALEASVGLDDLPQVRRLIEKSRETIARNPPKCALHTGDITKLFHAISRDTTGDLVDSDFSQQPNSIYKRLARNAELWPDLWNTDIKRAA